MLIGIGNPKAQRNPLEKDTRGGLCLLVEIVTGMKEQLVFALPKGVALEKRRVAAAVGIGHGIAEVGAGLAVETKELDANAAARTSPGGVEHMGGQIPHETSCG